MTWFEKIMPSRIKTERRTRSVPEGLWSKCESCEAVLYRSDLEKNFYVCPKCSHHNRISARERLDYLLDIEGRYEIGAEVVLNIVKTTTPDREQELVLARANAIAFAA